MKVIIERTYLEKETIGDLRITDDLKEKVFYTCHTVELPDKDNHRQISCIPEGCYIVVKEPPYGHFNYVHFRILNVPNRDGILIHIANYVSQLRGCIAPGKDLVDMNGDKLPDVNYSNVCLREMTEILPDKFTLEIVKKP